MADWGGNCGGGPGQCSLSATVWSLELGPSCLVKPYILYASCILVCFSDATRASEDSYSAPFRSRQDPPGTPEEGTGDGQTSPSVGEMGEGTQPFSTFKGIFEKMIPVTESLGMGAAASLWRPP